MALIKCPECGKELSDKANTCIHCGCPIEQKKQCEECGHLLSPRDSICPSCGCPVAGKIIIESKRDVSLAKFKNFYRTITYIYLAGLAIFVIGTLFVGLIGALVFAIPLAAFYLACTIRYNNAKKSFIRLTDDELYGEVYNLFSFAKISFPLDKISSINTIRILGIIDGIKIIPFSGIPQRILFIDNGEEFRQALLSKVLNKK